jgi:hypothetical protein
MTEQNPISAELRTQIILAAINTVGNHPGDAAAKQLAIRQAVIDIALMVADRSPIAKVIDQIGEAKAFRTIITNVQKEGSSQRGLITMRVKPSKYAKDGIEIARTERFDKTEGLAMGKALRGLIGHHVTIWIYKETPADGGNPVRMVAAFRDEGPATEDETNGVGVAPYTATAVRV